VQAEGAPLDSGGVPPTTPRDANMAFVVTEPCVNCKWTDCVAVCPMECFHEGETMLYIDPQECIDCEACVPECPVEAIYHESAVPEQWHPYIALNAEGARLWPRITERKAR
jgi:ferredoxin